MFYSACIKSFKQAPRAANRTEKSELPKPIQEAQTDSLKNYLDKVRSEKLKK